MFRRKKQETIPPDKELKLVEADMQIEESEKELVTAQRIASRFKEIREANHFAEQWRKVLGEHNG